MPQPSSPYSLQQHQRQHHQLPIPLPSSPPVQRSRVLPQLQPLAARPPVVGPEQQRLAAGVDQLDPLDLAGLEELEDKEDAHLLQESAAYKVNGCISIDDDETIVWLQYTRWPARLTGRPLDIISASTLWPIRYCNNYILGI